MIWDLSPRLYSRGCTCGLAFPPDTLRVLATDHLDRPVGYCCICGRSWYRTSAPWVRLVSGRTVTERAQKLLVLTGRP